VGAIYRQWRITGRQAQAHGPSGRRRAIRGRLSIWTVDLSPTVQLGGLTMLDRYQDQLAPSPERRDGGAGSKVHGGQPVMSQDIGDRRLRQSLDLGRRSGDALIVLGWIEDEAP
jgi:hypothetical protein